jgi:hypothetical protein
MKRIDITIEDLGDSEDIMTEWDRVYINLDDISEGDYHAAFE